MIISLPLATVLVDCCPAIVNAPNTSARGELADCGSARPLAAWQREEGRATARQAPLLLPAGAC